MFDLIATTLAWFYDLWPSFGMAIVLLTLLIMVILTPLTLKQTRSMIKMQHVAPELKKIQARYKDDRERMNKEVMAFYKANEVNPMSSCLPLFVQAPVFIVLYNVIRGLTRRLSDLGENAGWIAGRLLGDGEFSGEVTEPRVFFPDYLDPGSSMFQELSQRTEMVSWGFDLSRSANEALADGIVGAFPYFILILGVFVSSWYQQRQIRGRNPQAAISRQQELIFKYMPFFLPVISIGFDAALVVYFVASNLYRIAQQGYITRKFYGSERGSKAVVVPPPIGSEGRVGKKESSSKSGGNSQATSRLTSTEARGRRTTAGADKGSHSHKSNKPESEPKKKSEPDKKKTGNKEKSLANQAKLRRTRRKQRAEGPTPSSDGRPPMTRRTGGRTTPPGTNIPRGARKNRKKRK
ncbi:MAG: YidC/Oxa1 family membrane protein insertase [Actinomycetota bacterium]|nr:YidC/Oxa1 family membrane protein insertase [Actinomycetota bacterium]